MNQAITKMAAVQKGRGEKKKQEEGKKKKRLLRSLCCCLTALACARALARQMALGRSVLKDEVGCVCFLHLQPTSNVIVI